MNKTLTADEFLANSEDFAFIDDGNDRMYTDYYVKRNMIEFAKIKVKEALEAAAEKAFSIHKETENGDEYPVAKYSILNAYNLEDIK